LWILVARQFVLQPRVLHQEALGAPASALHDIIERGRYPLGYPAHYPDVPRSFFVRDGASGCYMVIDPKQDMFFVLLGQTPSERQRVQRTLEQLVHESLEN
jgi:CubicO group peptidase (beta-lactamase class C family)